MKGHSHTMLVKIEGDKMNKVKVEEHTAFMVKFRESFFAGEIDVFVRKSYLSVFDGWLTAHEFDSKIINATSEIKKEL